LQVRMEGGESDAMFQALKDLKTVAMVDALDLGEGRFEVQSSADQTSNKSVFDLCVQRGWVLTEMIPLETKLEDIFRDLTMN
jgi:ABC-2 type transport system ATP-binding protein